jgi:hypothetical protein
MIDIEMLEGMANGEALAIAERFGSVLLYTPVTKRSDFPSAVAYLVRRLDENTAEENYLRSSFTITAKSAEFEDQRRRFENAVHDRATISTRSLRLEKAHTHHLLEKFENQHDGDFTDGWAKHSKGSRPSPISISHSSSVEKRSSRQRPRRGVTRMRMARSGIATPSQIASI